MGCRIGMATDVQDRIYQLKNRNKIPHSARFRTVDSGMTYEEANKKEKDLRAKCGTHCEGQSGGMYKPGRIWSVYRVDW